MTQPVKVRRDQFAVDSLPLNLPVLFRCCRPPSQEACAQLPQDEAGPLQRSV